MQVGRVIPNAPIDAGGLGLVLRSPAAAGLLRRVAIVRPTKNIERGLGKDP